MAIIRITSVDEHSHITHAVSCCKVANFAEIMAIKRKAGCTENIL
jgi:hypothetical protein